MAVLLRASSCAKYCVGEALQLPCAIVSAVASPPSRWRMQWAFSSGGNRNRPQTNSARTLVEEGFGRDNFNNTYTGQWFWPGRLTFCTSRQSDLGKIMVANDRPIGACKERLDRFRPRATLGRNRPKTFHFGLGGPTPQRESQDTEPA